MAELPLQFPEPLPRTQGRPEVPAQTALVVEPVRGVEDRVEAGLTARELEILVGLRAEMGLNFPPAR